MNVGNNGAGVRAVTPNVRVGCMGFNPEFGLEKSYRWSRLLSYRNDRTHVKDMKNPLQIQLPGSNLFIVAHSAEISKDRISFTPFDDVPLDLIHSPTIKSSVSESHGVCIAGSTYAVNCSIASRTD